jgi:uncharacterized protein (TIGR00290 family)
MTRKPACFSWSGGKDSMLALWRAHQSGYNTRVLLSMLDESGEKNRSHAVPLHLLEGQAAALGAKLMTRSASWTDYEREFVAALSDIKAEGITTALFGDIDLQAHRDWEEKICAQAGMDAVLPLWNIDRREAVSEFLKLGYQAVVICVNHRWLDGSFCGRFFDEAFLQDLPPEVDWCGENGEFHTFVFNGPLFKAPVAYEIQEIYEYQLPPDFGSATFSYARLT